MTPDEAAVETIIKTDTEIAADDRAFVRDLVSKVIDESDVPDRDPATGRFKSDPALRSATDDTESEGEQPDEAAPEGASGDEDEGTDEPVSPAIDPPTSWTAEAREAFAKLPPELQQYVSTRESEREKGINAKLSEMADLRKRYETELPTFQQERQRYAQILEQVNQYTMTMDPVVAEGLKTDWVKLANEDPALYTAKKAAFDQRWAVMQAMQMEQQRVQQVNQQNARQEYVKKVTEVFPDYADPVKGKAMVDKWAPFLLQNGFSQAEVAETRNVMWDPRHLKIFDVLFDKASKYDASEAARKTVQAKKAAVQAAPINRPKANGKDTSTRETARVAALRKQYERTKSDRDWSIWQSAKYAEEPST